ncbi:TPA: hypothetical protein ACWCZX_002621 [Legionella pneumophila]
MKAKSRGKDIAIVCYLHRNPKGCGVNLYAVEEVIKAYVLRAQRKRAGNRKPRP